MDVCGGVGRRLPIGGQIISAHSIHVFALALFTKANDASSYLLDRLLWTAKHTTRCYSTVRIVELVNSLATVQGKKPHNESLDT